jgi:N-methylhydantoinase B/oxoprolinase/acetone carboxylase alpha subunit
VKSRPQCAQAKRWRPWRSWPSRVTTICWQCGQVGMPPDATSTSQRGKLLKNAMDHSSAICDADMRLIAQGLTLPLHLGSLPDALDAVRARFGDAIRPGDVYILNDPYEGGTPSSRYLPDSACFSL